MIFLTLSRRLAAITTMVRGLPRIFRFWISSFWCKSKPSSHLNCSMKPTRWTSTRRDPSHTISQGLHQYFELDPDLGHSFMEDKGRRSIYAPPSNDVVLSFVLAWNEARTSARLAMESRQEQLLRSILRQRYARNFIVKTQEFLRVRKSARERELALSRENRNQVHALQSMEEVGSPKELPSISSQDSQAIVAIPTQFPALGSDFTCDCWESYYVDMPRLLARFIKTFGLFEIQARCLVESVLPTLLLVRRENKHCLLVTKFETTYSFFETRDCHQTSSKENWINDHQACLVLRVRLEQEEAARVLDWNGSNVYFRDVSELVVDQHAHSAFVTTLHPVPATSADMVLSNGVLLSRSDKAAQRRARRADNKELRKAGIKPKRVQLPIRYRGLTTQEYHEVRTREKQEFQEYFETNGIKGLPQAVKEYLKYGTGHEWWENIHVWAIDRPEFASTSLKKLNGFLQSLGCPFPLEIRPGKIEKVLAARAKYNASRSTQIQAASARTFVKGKGKMASVSESKWVKTIEAEREVASRRGWADYEDDDLGDLPIF